MTLGLYKITVVEDVDRALEIITKIRLINFQKRCGLELDFDSKTIKKCDLFSILMFVDSVLNMIYNAKEGRINSQIKF